MKDKTAAYYRLNEDYALREWKFVSHVMYHRYTAAPIRLDDEMFQVLLKCDGEHPLEESEVLEKLIQRGVVEQCNQGDGITEWSRRRRYEHRFVPYMNLMITGKCNYNCRHCFNAADNAERMAEWDYSALLDLFDQAAECGIHGITLTGGEPMLHPRFSDIVRGICKRNMAMDKVATNGHFLNDETLDLFQELRAFPQIKISFDGIGSHDYLRGRSGAERDALRAFRLCADRGFWTLAQTQVYRDNLKAMRRTLEVLEDLGVTSTRIIRTTPVPRWVKNEPNGTIPVGEYFEQMLDLAEWYMRGRHKMSVIIWRFLELHPQSGSYHVVMDQRPDGSYRPTTPVCGGNRTMMAVTCEGNVVPCLQMSDYVAHLGQKFDSLKERSLEEILTNGEWLDAVCKNHYWLRERNKTCDACEWFGHCGGGCRALGILDAGEKTGGYDYGACDPLACLFYKGGWYDKVRERMSGFRKI